MVLARRGYPDYVRQYRTPSGATRWALYHHDGGRYRRVGTAHTVEGYLIFLGFRGENLAFMVRARDFVTR